MFALSIVAIHEARVELKPNLKQMRETGCGPWARAKPRARSPKRPRYQARLPVSKRIPEGCEEIYGGMCVLGGSQMARVRRLSPVALPKRLPEPGPVHVALLNCARC